MKYCPFNFMALELMAAFEIETDSAANWIAIHFLEKQSGMKMGTNSIFEPSMA